MTENKTTKIEREYVIPLREKCRPVPRYKKTPKAVKTVKEFIARHMKIQDRDTKKVKLDRILNEALWFRGIKKPIHKIKVKAVKEGDVVRVFAIDLPSKLKFKQAREEKKSKVHKEAAKEAQKAMAQAKKETEKQEEPKEDIDKDNDGVDDKIEEKEAQKSTEESAKEAAKEESKDKSKTDKKVVKKEAEAGKAKQADEK